MPARAFTGLLIAVCLAAAVARSANSASFVPARVTSGDGTRAYNLGDQRLRLDTRLGRAEFWLHDLRLVQFDATNGLCRVETSHGDTWYVEGIGPSLQYYDLDATLPLSLTEGSVRRIELTGAGDAWRPQERARLVLKDGGRVWLDTGRWTFEVRNGCGVWALPLGSVRTLKMLFSLDASESRAIVRFPSGRIESFTPVSRSRTMAVTDSYGNELAFAFEDAWGLVGRMGLPDKMRAPGETPEKAGKADAGGKTPPAVEGNRPVRVISGEGRQQILDLPVFVLEVAGAAGRVRLPTPTLCEVTIYEEGRVARAATVFGEQFIGSLHPSEILLPATGADSRPPPLAVLKQQLFQFDGPKMEIPPDWPVWRLRGGNVFAARFSGDTLEATDENTGKDVQIPTRRISVALRQGTRISIETDDGARVVARPRSSAVDVVLLCNGMRHRLPWKLVESVRAGPPQATATNLPPQPDPSAWFNPAGAATRLLADDMILFAGKPFTMGRSRGEGLPDEQPPHLVTLRAFHMDACEITRAQFADFASRLRFKTDAERAGESMTWQNPGFLQRPDEPVVCVSWYDAVRFCNWRSQEAGLQPCYEFLRGGEVVCHPELNGYRLPTEAEWEFAARNGGCDILYPWGDEWAPAAQAALANFRQEERETQDRWVWTNPVKAFPPNAAGLYGMAGNVWEWCEDWYFAQAYASVHRQRPADPCVTSADVAGLARKVIRGGSFDNEIDLLRCASRGNGLPLASANRVGFRCVRTAEEAARP